MDKTSAILKFDTVAKAVAIIGGLVSAFVLIISLRESTNQRATELRWNQAKLAAELQDDMFINDPQSFNALRMTDWTSFEFLIDGKKVSISREEAKAFLENDKNLPPKGVFVRESFDRLFYRMGKVERALHSNLIKFEDVCSPMDYYVPFLRSTYGPVLDAYMTKLRQDDAREFMQLFNNNPKCSH